ncbi:MAG TPA: hypothetical protein VHB97_06905 [Polyangia bacterium]|nr:hypothetical protein [Polyangia bacterium]
MRMLASGWLLSVLWVAGCSGAVLKHGNGGESGDDLTSVGGTTKQVDWDSFVYVGGDADVPTIQAAIAKQVKSSLGALREIGIGIEDRGALHNLDPAAWTRDSLNVVDTSGHTTGSVQRVRYHYTDTALVQNGPDPGAAFSFTMLFGDYSADAAALQPACVDEATDADSIWYHYAPRQSACAALINAETATINSDLSKLPPSTTPQIPASDANRRFVGVRGKLTPQAAAPTKYPEYDRLWGFGSDRDKVVVYAFVGVESNERDSHDLGAIEYQRLQRTLRAKFPKLAVTYTNPQAMLLDFYVDGSKLGGVTWDDVERWMIDDTGYPAAVGSDAQKIEALRQQVIDRFSERWIYWDLPATVTLGGQTRQMTVELRTFWGVEDDGTADTKQRAVWRYLEAFWYGDIFAYAGHSHFGHGPLEPTNYAAANFPDRYQVMLVNSCLSYNYYDLDFIAMHPEGSRNLEVVMNGLPAYWNGMGESTADYLIALLDGSNKSWAQLLDAMRINEPWGESNYEPMRGVNGELDNVFDGSKTPITVAY